MKIGIFCSANDSIDPDFVRMTEELGRWMAAHHHTLVYGGCDMGLMKTIGHAVHDNGGTAIGVVPRIIESHGRVASCLDVDIPVDNLSDRKDIILSQSDILIALPGGIGTLDEVFTVAAAKTIGYHSKRVILYNMKGFWNKTIEMIGHLDSQGMIRGDYRSMIDSVDTLEEIADIIASEQ